jgi:hypothetical protein
MLEASRYDQAPCWIETRFLRNDIPLHQSEALLETTKKNSKPQLKHRLHARLGADADGAAVQAHDLAGQVDACACRSISASVS